MTSEIMTSDPLAFPFHGLFATHHMVPPPNPGALTRLDGLKEFSPPPAPAACWNHLGDACFEQRRIVETLACYHKALRLGGDHAERIERRWMAWMMLGHFERAWRESDRLEQFHRARHGPDAHAHTWDGRPFTGKRVLLRCAHGLGDTVQFIRYLPLLRARCATLILQAQRILWPLLGELPGVDRIIPSWEVQPPDLEYDSEIEIMELPYLFRSTPATLPARVPYLHPDPGLVALIRRRVEKERRLKIGLVWASSAWYAARSVPLGLFEPLLRLPGVVVYNLQFGPEREELDQYPGLPLREVLEPDATIAHTAALMLALDLIVTPDTLTAHLAGALGRPVRVLLLHKADWRWMVGRKDSPWYPTMRLFRQPRPGNWSEPIARLTEEVRRSL